MNSILIRIVVAILATLVLGTLMGCQTTGTGRVIVPTNPGERVVTPYIGVSPNAFRAESRPVIGPDGSVYYETVMVPVTVRDEIELRRQAEWERDAAHRRAMDRRRQAEWEAENQARQAQWERDQRARNLQTLSREVSGALSDAQRRNENRLRNLQTIRDNRPSPSPSVPVRTIRSRR